MIKTRKEIWTKYNNSKKGKLYRDKYYQEHKEQIKNRVKNYTKTKEEKETQKKAMVKKKELYPQEVKARDTLNRLFRDSCLANDDFICAICGKQPIEKHHENYDLWNVFIPLCREHHKTGGK